MEKSIQDQIQTIGKQARQAARELTGLTTEQKNRILLAMADALDENRLSIRSNNARDVEEAREKGLSGAMIDRLILDEKRIGGMITGIREIAALDDPTGKELKSWKRPNGLEIRKISVPIGVIGMIYESRPNVTVDAAALCLKASNAIILRGGSEAFRSNQSIASVMIKGGVEAGLPEHAMQLIPVRSRDAVKELVTMDNWVDLIIPRGGEGLIRAVAENATVPVLKHYKGVCHVYVDGSADRGKALNIIENAKCQRPGVCNAAETLLVDKSIATEWLPEIAARLDRLGVELRGCEETGLIVKNAVTASEEDWTTEYLDLVLSVKVVNGIGEAVDHINTYGTGHSDAIIAEDRDRQEYFGQRVDSAAVYINASTRFTDGAAFGMGAEIGISTDRLHARGPVGLEELTTYKYVVVGNGQIRK